MDLATAQQESNTYSKQASELCRQISYAGLAGAWAFFYHKDTSHFDLGNWFLNGAIVFFVSALTADLFQYVLYADKYRALYLAKENEFKDSGLADYSQETFEVPQSFLWPDKLFWLKRKLALCGVSLFFFAIADAIFPGLFH